MALLNDTFDNLNLNDDDDDCDNEEFYDTQFEPSIISDTSNSSDTNLILNGQSRTTQQNEQPQQIFYAVQFLDESQLPIESISENC